MKHIWRHIMTLTILALLVGNTVNSVSAQTTTKAQTPSSTPTNISNSQLEDLKDRLATKVAELRDIIRRAVHGTVKSVSVSSATVETDTKDIKIELADDIAVAQVINGKRTELTIEDVATDDVVTVFGSYDDTLDLLKAKVIFIESSRVVEHVSGTVTDIDRDEATIVVETPEGGKTTVDIEKSTKTTIWTTDGGMAKGGFSKIVTGDTVHLAGTAVPKEENNISAIRILDLGNLSGSMPPVVSSPSPTPSSIATPRATLRPTARPAVSPTP